MDFAGLVLNISRQYLFIRDALCHSGGVCQDAANIVAHVDNQAVADSQLVQCLVQITVAYPVREAGAVDVADVVLQNAGCYSLRVGIILSQIYSLDAVAEVTRVTVEPFAVLRGSQRAGKIHMSVVQFVYHIRKDLEEILPRHVRRNAACIALVHLVPVESVLLIFIVEETILFVDDFP